jgi:hypothetical protein
MTENLSYVYQNIVTTGPLERMLTAQKSKSDLEERVLAIHRCFLGLREELFPEDLWPEVRLVRSLGLRPIKPQHQELADIIGPLKAKARSLTKRDRVAIIKAFVTLVVEVSKRLPAKSKWRGIKHDR